MPLTRVLAQERHSLGTRGGDVIYAEASNAGHPVMTDTQLDRRNFLKRASAAASVALITPRPLRAQSRHDVIVVGAGLSGLNAALMLEAEGVNVQVLEGRKRVGGRVLSMRNVPGNPEAGGTSFFPGYARLLDAAERYGVDLIDITPRVPYYRQRELALGSQIISKAEDRKSNV